MTTGFPTLEDAGVSSREAEVLELLGEHLTNAEIGARLYISVRTVESHVSSLLRKLTLADRRALAQFAAGLRSDAAAAGSVSSPTSTDTVPVESALPSPLTSFVGRAGERAALAEALERERLVTAVGPGGVGKTRLALAVAADLADRYGDGVWYVDLVPVTDPAMIATAVSAALGLGDQPGRSMDQTVLGRLADSEALVILDNCEHLVDSVVLFLERLLAACPRVTVLATSRARLLVPFERMFPVGGLSTVTENDEATSDAVELFLARAASVGSVPRSAEDRRRVASICAQLDGMALAIELAAARLPALGLDGLEAGLDDQLHVLAGRGRVDERHSSLRAALDWSYALLSPLEQAVLRRLSVFAAPFKAEDAAAVVAFEPVAAHDVGHALAQLADQSLLVVTADPAGTRYRALESIRQYGSGRLDQAATADESDDVRLHHLRWCLGIAEQLGAATTKDAPDWRAAFDDAADDLRAALVWATDQPAHRSMAHDLAILLADLTYGRGLVGECQRRYEQAADLADEPAAQIDALRRAAGAAQSRHVGQDALRLRQEAAEVARQARDAGTAATELAIAAMLVNRFPGTLWPRPPEGTAQRFLAQSRVLAVGCSDPAVAATLLVAEAFSTEERDPVTLILDQRAADLARHIGDPVLESAALDGIMAIHLANGDLLDAAAAGQRRIDLLEPLPIGADSGFELLDAYQMAVEISIGVGDVATARHLANCLLDLPIYRNEGHLATARLLLVEGLAGDWERLLDASERFVDSWELAGKPHTSNLSVGASAVAMVHGLRGDDAARAEWLAIVELLWSYHRDEIGPGSSVPSFDAIVALHRGRSAEALAVLTRAPEDYHEWYTGRWRQWHAAVWAEAAVVAGQPDAPARVDRARFVARGNPIATAMLDRASILATDHWDAPRLVAIARALEDAGCRYQAARTLVFAGGEAAADGERLLADMGATPMVVEPREPA